MFWNDGHSFYSSICRELRLGIRVYDKQMRNIFICLDTTYSSIANWWMGV